MAELTGNHVSKQVHDLFEKGQTAMKRNLMGYAISMFSAALELQPKLLEARKHLLTASLRQFTASKSAKSLRPLYTMLALPGLIWGFLLLKIGKPLDALRIGDRLLCKDPLNLIFIRLAGKGAEAAGMPDATIQILSMAREYYPENVDLIGWLGHVYTVTGQLNEARECLEAVVDLRPNDAAAKNALKDAMARDSLAKGGWVKATEKGGSYRDVLKDVKESALLEQEGKAVKTERNLEFLIKEAEQKLHNDRENIALRRGLSNLYVQVNRFDDAIRVLEEARAITGSGDPQIDRSLTTIHLKQYDYEIGVCRENSDQAGILSKQNEKKAFLLKDMHIRVEHYPNDLPLRYEYGVALCDSEQANEAIQHLQLAQRNPHYRVQAGYYLALCFKQKNQLDMAREQLEKIAVELTEMNDLKKDVYYQLGDVLARMGDSDQAVNKYYKEIYRVDIGYKDIASKIEKSYEK